PPSCRGSATSSAPTPTSEWMPRAPSTRCGAATAARSKQKTRTKRQHTSPGHLPRGGRGLCVLKRPHHRRDWQTEAVSDNHPELDGYEPFEPKPQRGKRKRLILQLVVLAAVTALVLPGVLTTASVASRNGEQ